MSFKSSKQRKYVMATISERCLLHGHNYGKHIKDCPDYRKESREHPSFTRKQIIQIIKDHEYKKKLKRCERKVKGQVGYNPYAVCRASVKK